MSKIEPGHDKDMLLMLVRLKNELSWEPSRNLRKVFKNHSMVYE